jgi:hypothetical protein
MHFYLVWLRVIFRVNLMTWNLGSRQIISGPFSEFQSVYELSYIEKTFETLFFIIMFSPLPKIKQIFFQKMIIHTPNESSCRFDVKNAFFQNYPAQKFNKRVEIFALFLVRVKTL